MGGLTNKAGSKLAPTTDLRPVTPLTLGVQFPEANVIKERIVSIAGIGRERTHVCCHRKTARIRWSI